MKRLVLLAVLIVGLATAARADFATGLRSYEAGDYYAAYKEWLPLAEAGDPAAQRNLGHLYRLGRGVTKDFVKAAEWYRKSAEQGFARAQANLGNMYLRGQGVPKDPITAAKWFGRAAKQEHSIAQFNLGLMYENGIGLAQDDVAALGWYYRASKAGHRKAAQRLARLVSRGATPPTDDTLAPNEPDKRDRLASAQRGKPAQPLYGESASGPADADGADSGDADSGDAGPDKDAGDRSATESPQQPASSAPHPVIIAEAREDAARAKANPAEPDTPPASTAQGADKGEQPADPPAQPVEPVAAPAQAKDETAPAAPVPPHPVIVAEAAAAAIREGEGQAGTAAPVQEDSKQIDDAPDATTSEDSVAVIDEAPESVTTDSDPVPPPAFLVREAEQQREPKKESVAVETGTSQRTLPRQEEGDTSAEAASVPESVPERASKKSTVKQKAIELAALRRAARRAARFERRLQSQLPEWASEFKNVPSSSDADAGIEKTMVSESPEPQSGEIPVAAESADEGRSDSGHTGGSTDDRETPVAASSEPTVTPVVSSAPQSTIGPNEKGSPDAPVETAVTDTTVASDDVSPKPAVSASLSASAENPAGPSEAGVGSETEPKTDSSATQADAKTDAAQGGDSLSSALASAVADLADSKPDKDAAATKAAAAAAHEDESSSEEPPADQKTATAVGQPATHDPDAVAASTEASPSSALESAATADGSTAVAAASVAAESDREAGDEADGSVAVSLPQPERTATPADDPELPADTTSSDLATESQPDSTTVETGSSTSDVPQRVASLADEQAPTSTATKGDKQESPSEAIPAVPDSAVEQETSGDSEPEPATEAPSPSLPPEVTPQSQTEDPRAEPLSAEIENAAPPAPDEPTNTETAEAPQTATGQIVAEPDEDTRSSEAGGDGQAAEEPQAPSSPSAVQTAGAVSDGDPATMTKPDSDLDSPVQVAAVSAAVAEPSETETAGPQDREGIEPDKAMENSETNTPAPAPAKSARTTSGQPSSFPAPDADPDAARSRDVATAPAVTPKQPTDDLLEQERREMERERIAEQRRTTREEQARRRIRKLLKIQESWELAALRRDQATSTQNIRDGSATPGRLPAEKPKSDVSPSAPPPKPPTENVATAPAAAADGKSNSVTDQLATVKPDIKSETSSPAEPLGKPETSSPAPPLGVALDAGLSAYQANDYAAAFRYWLPPAENGDPNAQFFVGGLYRDGAGVPEDLVRAFHWWTLAAGQGHRQADRLLAELESEMLPEEIAAAKKLSE